MPTLSSMLHSVTTVAPLKNFFLQLSFDTGETKKLDMKPYLDIGKFSELKDPRLFRSVRVVFDTIQWSNKMDLSPEFLYEKSVPA